MMSLFLFLSFFLQFFFFSLNIFFFFLFFLSSRFVKKIIHALAKDPKLGDQLMKHCTDLLNTSQPYTETLKRKDEYQKEATKQTVNVNIFPIYIFSSSLFPFFNKKKKKLSRQHLLSQKCSRLLKLLRM